MSGATRRNFLAMAGAGAAVVGASAVPSASASPKVGSSSTVSEPVVAYIRDVATGELSVMVGEREIVVHDRDLVNRLARVAS